MSTRAPYRRIGDLLELSGIPSREKNPQKETRSAEAECTKMYMSTRAPARRIGDLFAAGYTEKFTENIMQIANQEEFFYIKNGKSEISIQNDGQIFRLDYLYISDDSVVITEVKTGIVDSTNIPLQYRQQLTNYCEIIEKMFTTKKVMAYFLLVESASFIPFEYK
jgi:hypothetical protein